ncbi:V-set and immunoglobulin domain-containing protein 2 isoform X2 [Sturnira hondurensis]|uniref:V-set and immunoglobulin domain-containing protein 2 isoform X2 n=1 Tax=Sturnira hondurensis TaxID=192404 RepID=UPI00187A793D|nr:V-set and immunoglobulin domain-containing protein 2 isoform X2 [Sturnira hondurensis]
MSFASSQVVRPRTSASRALWLEFRPLPFKCPVPAPSFPQGHTASEISGRIRAKMVPELGPEKGEALSYWRARASPLVCSSIASFNPCPAPGGCPVGAAAPSWTRTPDPRREDPAMARLLGPVLCGALLGLVCLTAPGPAVEVHVPAEPLSAPAGKTAELTCSYSTSVTDSFALEWSFVQPGKPISASLPILYFTNGHLYPTGSKAKRASLLQNPPTGGVATLKLTDVHPSDTGTYLCQVNNPPDFYTNGMGLINLTVLDEVTGQLILSNLSLASSGTYRCVATNQMGSAACELRFSVTDPSQGRVAGAVIGVLLGVLLLSIAVFCLIRFQKERRKRPKETYGGSDLREDAIAPGISEQTPARADSNSGLLEKPLSASTMKTTKSKLPMAV